MAEKKSQKPRVRRLSKPEARTLLGSVAQLLNKPTLTGDETQQAIVDLKSVIVFVRDWSRFMS